MQWMMQWIMMMLPFLMAVSTTSPACQVLQTDAILARDVTVVIPGFTQVPGDFRLGYVASSGTPRIFRGADLERIAKNQGVDLADLPDVCFTLRTFVPQPDDIAAAVRKSLGNLPGIGDAKIEILVSSQNPVPAGELIFPREQMQPQVNGEQAVMWRGLVRQADREFPVWARLRVTANTTRVVALANIPTGKPIQENQIRLETCEDSLLDETTARSLDQVVGYLPKSMLRAYFPIRRTQLAPVPDVTRGQLVDVQVSSGDAHLMLKGRAETDGVAGSMVTVRNISSGKDFRARVKGKNQVVVEDFLQ